MAGFDGTEDERLFGGGEVGVEGKDFDALRGDGLADGVDCLLDLEDSGHEDEDVAANVVVRAGEAVGHLLVESQLDLPSLNKRADTHRSSHEVKVNLLRPSQRLQRHQSPLVADPSCLERLAHAVELRLSRLLGGFVARVVGRRKMGKNLLEVVILNGVGEAGDLDARGAAEVFRELGLVDGSGHL